MTGHSDCLTKFRHLPMIALETLFLICLAGCDSRQTDRSGVYGLTSFDATPLTVMIGEARFLLPRNCLDSPIETEAKRGDMHVTNGVLLLALLPDLSCINNKNSDDFFITGESSPLVVWSVDKIGKSIPGEVVLKRHFDLQSIKDPNYVTGSLKKRGIGASQIVSLGLLNIVMNRIDTREIFGDPSLGSFVYCSKYTHRAQDRARSMVANCEQEFLYNGLVVKASYGRGWLAKKDEIRLNIVSKLNSFKISGE